MDQFSHTPTTRWPSSCAVCRSWGAGLVCGDCVLRFAQATTRCQRCALPLALPAPACGVCLAEPPPFVRTVCALEYGFPWAGLITRFKFDGALELAAPLAERLRCAVIESNTLVEPSPSLPPLVLPVPLSRQRLAERGFNQAWELARRMAGNLRLQARADLLHRAIDNPAQSGLSRSQRLANLRGAFTASGPASAALVGRRVALVDDVMTTGATAAAAASALLRAGAAAVELWVLARTPAPSEDTGG